MNLLHQSCTTQRFVIFNTTQIKEKSYHNQCPINQFFQLVIEVFSYLHKHADVFLQDCINAIWSLKETKGFHLSTLVIFLCHKISITLQRMQVSSILSRAIIIG
jgi:hypothetical protein